MNPFLYHSSHPPGIVKSLIHGLIQTYHRQNTEEMTFKKNVKQLFKRLIAWGHLYEDIHPIFLQAAEKIDKKEHGHARQRHTIRTVNQAHQHSLSRPQDRRDIFFHLPYHPKDISRKEIHRIYQNTCDAKDNLKESFQEMDNGMGGTMKITKLTIAYSRGQNLRVILCSSSLQKYKNCKVSTLLTP